MIAAVKKASLFESFRIPSQDGYVLHAQLLLPRPPRAPKRVVVITPLVGATATQALLLFRSLTRRGSAVLSFAYRGHADSTGQFELDETLVDTHHALQWASKYAREHGLPMHGCATCFGTVPLLAQFAGGLKSPPLWSISAVSGLLQLDQILRFDNFAPVLARVRRGETDSDTLLREIVDHSLDVHDYGFRQALSQYLQTLFPELRVGKDYFEELQYDRTNIAATLSQWLRAHYLDDVEVPTDVPCRFFYGRQDHLLGLHQESGRRVYCERARSIVPHAELCEVEIDHYGRGADHQTVLDSLSDLFESAE